MFSALSLSLALLFVKGIAFLTGYVSSGSVFPQPLTQGEELELLMALESGDSRARNALIERNLRLVAHVAKKFDATGEDPDDLISIGTIGLIKAINTFNRGKNTRLATYAARCIENEILMHLRATRRSKSEVLLYDPIGADKEGNEISLIDVLGTDADTVSEAVEQEAEQANLHEKIRLLTRREKKVLELRYGLYSGIRKTQREISKLLGISRSYVSRIEKRALSKLYAEMFTH